MILLDTSAVIMVGCGRNLARAAIDAIERAETAKEPVFVSAITAWELCILERLSRTGPVIGGDGARFFRDAVVEMSLTTIDIDDDIAIGSRRLPGSFHDDPADRFLIATARQRKLTVMTSDRAIFAYADQGHVDAIAC